MKKSYQDIMRDFCNDVSRNTEIEKEEKAVEIIPPSKSIAFTNNLFFTNDKNICKIDEDERCRRIEIYMSQFIYEVFEEKQENKIVLFFDEIFLKSFLTVLQKKVQTKQISYSDVVHLNGICYKLMTMRNDKKPHNYGNISPYIMRIIDEINSSMNPKLFGLGLPKNISNIILCARYSSYNEQIVVRRVNFLLVNNLPEEIVTEKLLTDILSVIFNGTNTWIRVFYYYMTDILPDTYKYGENVQINRVISNDSVLNLAYLNCLNNQTIPCIELILKEYADCLSLNSAIKTRYSLRSLSQDYYCINQAIYNLEMVGDYVP